METIREREARPWPSKEDSPWVSCLTLPDTWQPRDYLCHVRKGNSEKSFRYPESREQQYQFASAPGLVIVGWGLLEPRFPRAALPRHYRCSLDGTQSPGIRGTERSPLPRRCRPVAGLTSSVPGTQEPCWRVPISKSRLAPAPVKCRAPRLRARRPAAAGRLKPALAALLREYVVEEKEKIISCV